MFFFCKSCSNFWRILESVSWRSSCLSSVSLWPNKTLLYLSIGQRQVPGEKDLWSTSDQTILVSPCRWWAANWTTFHHEWIGGAVYLQRWTESNFFLLAHEALYPIFYFLLKENQPTIKVPQDKLLAELVLKHKDNIWKIHDHDSLLENQVDEHLTEEERKAAWDEFENEKKGIINMTNSVNLNQNLVMSQINPEMIRVRLFHILLYRVHISQLSFLLISDPVQATVSSPHRGAN